MSNLIIILAAISSMTGHSEPPPNIDYSQAVAYLEEAIKNIPPEPDPIPEPPPPPDPVACSCVLYAAQFIKLPPIRTPADLEENSTLWEAKAVLLDYKLPHIAVIEKITNDGIVVRESNFKACTVSIRLIDFNDKHLRGFWKPS